MWSVDRILGRVIIWHMTHRLEELSSSIQTSDIIIQVILSTWSPWLYKADQLLCTWLTAPPNYNSISIWNNGPRAGSQPIKCIYNSDIFIFSQPRLTACCEKKMCARCANWKTEQQLIVMSSGKNSRMNKMQDIPSWPESSEAQTFPVYFWIVLFIGDFLPKFFARLMRLLGIEWDNSPKRSNLIC